MKKQIKRALEIVEEIEENNLACCAIFIKFFITFVLIFVIIKAYIYLIEGKKEDE